MKNETTKESLRIEIEELLSYNPTEKLEINPNYLEYFEIDELNSIKATLLKRKGVLSIEDIEWLEQFKTYE